MTGRVVFRLDIVDRGPAESPEVRYDYAPGCDSWRVAGIVQYAANSGGLSGEPQAYFTRSGALRYFDDPYAWHDPWEGR